MKQKKIAQKILKKAWEELQNHRRDDLSQLYFDGKTEFTFFEWKDTHKPIPIKEAQDELFKLITTSLQSYGKVIIYSCKDNANISVELGDEHGSFGDYESASELDSDIPELLWSWD